MSLQLPTALLPLSVHPHVTPAPHCSPSSVRTPTCHSSSSLLSFLCPHNHQHTEPADSILTALSLTPSLSIANNENGPQQAELHEGRHTQQLCQSANGRADWTAGNLYIRRPSNQREAVRRKAVHSEEVNCQQHSKENLCKAASRQCTRRPASRSRRIVNSAFPCDSKQPSASNCTDHSLPVVHRGPPFESSRAWGGHRAHHSTADDKLWQISRDLTLQTVQPLTLINIDIYVWYCSCHSNATAQYLHIIGDPDVRQDPFLSATFGLLIKLW